MLHSEWAEKCSHWKQKWPLYLDQFKNDQDGINLYSVIEYLNIFSKSYDVFIVDAGSANYVGSQNLRIKQNQYFINPGSQGDMGFALPASIGIGLADFKYNPVVITGDGSFNTNIQELATIKANNIKSKIFILDNDGYLSIRNTQANFYNNNIYGESNKTGLFFPNLKTISEAYEIKYFLAENNQDLAFQIQNFLHADECIIFHIKCKHTQEIIPTLTLKTDLNGNKVQCGLEDMYPFLSAEELELEMID